MLWTAFMMGLVGNFHCAGMCGPIAIALPLDRTSWIKRLWGSILYNLGRTITYALLGAFFGLVGQGVVLAGFQQWLSIIMGVLMILIVLFPSLFKNPFEIEKGAFRFVGKLKQQLRQLFSQASYSSLFFIGLLNGILPCGLVYFAIVGAIASGNVLMGALYMALFGLGTMPIMFAIPLLGNVLTGQMRQRLSKAIPVMMILIGGLFVVRGLGLQIPYLSPPEKVLNIKNAKKIHEKRHTIGTHKEEKTEEGGMSCH